MSSKALQRMACDPGRFLTFTQQKRDAGGGQKLGNLVPHRDGFRGVVDVRPRIPDRGLTVDSVRRPWVAARLRCVAGTSVPGYWLNSPPTQVARLHSMRHRTRLLALSPGSPRPVGGCG